jgi:hypothetical protein
MKVSKHEHGAQDTSGRSSKTKLGGRDDKLEEDNASPYAQYCRDNAKIWSKYLKETDNEDKEVTSIGNSSLDSMLTFVSRKYSFESDSLLISTRPVCSPASWPRSS